MKVNRKKLKIDKSKTINLNKYLDDKYGEKDTETRDDFMAKADAFYYGEILKERRKELKLSQIELANKIGKPRPYISQVENGRDLQLSNLITIANALGLSLVLKPV